MKMDFENALEPREDEKYAGDPCECRGATTICMLAFIRLYKQRRHLVRRPSHCLDVPIYTSLFDMHAEKRWAARTSSHTPRNLRAHHHALEAVERAERVARGVLLLLVVARRRLDLEHLAGTSQGAVTHHHAAVHTSLLPVAANTHGGLRLLLKPVRRHLHHGWVILVHHARRLGSIASSSHHARLLLLRV